MKVILDDSFTSSEAVRDSLINGLVYLARRDWDALLVVDPGPAPPKSSRNWLLRLGLAGTLVAAAFAMPLLLGDALSTDLASWRITLIVSAGFALISPDPQKARDALVSFRS